MEHAFRQLQFEWRFLTAFRTGLAGIVWRHLMEMFTLALCYPVAPVKEHPPRRISNRLGKVAVLHHVTRSKFLSNHCIKSFVVKKLICCFRDKIKTLTGNNIRLLCQRVFRLIPAFAPVLLARKGSLQAYQLLFRLSIKSGIGFPLTFGSRQKRVCPDIDTTSRFGNTFGCVRHFTDDEAIPAACRLFQRDLFRVSIERPVLADSNFTEFRHFQTVVPSACFTDWILTNPFTCLECVFSQRPRQGMNGTLESRIPLFLHTFATSAAEMFMCGVDALDCRDLHILRVIGIMRVRGAKVLQMVNLVIHRHRLLTILPHLMTHLKHIVLQLLLVPKLRKKPLLLYFSRIRTIFKCLLQGFHVSRFYPLQSGRQTRHRGPHPLLGRGR